ncbi:MAG TPA: hypothetical protein VG323_02290 [Thermoanaerobaculia bacterium]|nr:hypothetical protein [Thermoanaerobaculia bacterium]
MIETSTACFARVRRRRAAVGVNALAVTAAAMALLFMRPEDRLIAAPMFSLAVAGLFYMTALWVRDGEVPLFEAGTLLVLSTVVYVVLALAGFLEMHGSWDVLSDSRLQSYPFDPAEIGAIGWRCAAYLAAFIVVYLLVRGGAAVKRTPMSVPSGATFAAVLVLLMVLWFCKIALRIAYGIGTVSYDNLDQLAASLQQVPYVVQQVGHNVISALLIVQQAILVFLMLLWRHRLSRAAVVVWLVADAAATAAHLGARTPAVLLILSAGLIYHRVVRPLPFSAVLAGGALLLAGFLAVGQVRSLGASAGSGHGLLTSTNEFQALFTNAFDLYKRREMGLLPLVPWQIHVSDFYMAIPSQLLPFTKLEPSTWYAGVIGLGDTGVGLMFGVLAQAAVGWDWIELVLRGVALGVVFALLHRWYVRHAAQLWPTLFYLFVTVWAYYTYRATSFWFVYLIVYQFLPAMVAAKLIELSLQRVLVRRVESAEA